jgi:hypothetical protein
MMSMSRRDMKDRSSYPRKVKMAVSALRSGSAIHPHGGEVDRAVRCSMENRSSEAAQSERHSALLNWHRPAERPIHL